MPNSALIFACLCADPHKSRKPVEPGRLSTGPGPIRQDGTVRWRSRQGGHTNRHEGLAAALEATGFWAGLPSRDGVRLRDEVAQGASPVTGLAGRGWRADGEDLAEGDVEELLRSMIDALRHRGVSLTVESVRRPRDDRSTGYTLRINGELLDLFDYDPANRGMPLVADPWMDCTVKPLVSRN